jgi:hypothetical protein
MKGITEDFVWGILASLFIVAVSIIIFQFSNLSGLVNNLIIILMTLNLVTTTYYTIYISRHKLTAKEKIKEINLKLKALNIGKKEAKKAYLSRKIKEETYDKLIQDYNQEEIVLKSELKSLESR